MQVMTDAYYYSQMVGFPLGIIALGILYLLIRWANYKFPRR